MDNSTILVIPDLQAPFHHKDAISFLKEIKRSLNPTRIIDIGDMYDFSCFSDYAKNPNLMGTSEEILAVRKFIQELGKLFPNMDILDSNHGNRIRRKAHNSGLPEVCLKDEAEILQFPSGWKIHSEIVLKTDHGNNIKFVHNYSSNVLNSSKDMACSLVQGHFHSKFETHYWSNGIENFFASTVGCLIDTKSPAFSYNITQSKRPVLGALIIKGMSVIHIPMHVSPKTNRWVGYI